MVEEPPRISYIEHEGERLAMEISRGHPGLFFLTGFASGMTGNKAVYLRNLAHELDLGFTRFDYSGHGQSSGDFADGSLTQWLSDALAVFDQTEGPQILVGSSMGGWLGLHVALTRPGRIASYVGIATAPDFTETLIWNHLSPAQRNTLETTGSIEVPSEYGAPTIITNKLIESGRQLLLLNRPIAITCPMRLIHGLEDRDVPWETSLQLAQMAQSNNVTLHLVKDGGHRLSRDGDLALLRAAVLSVLPSDDRS